MKIKKITRVDKKHGKGGKKVTSTSRESLIKRIDPSKNTRGGNRLGAPGGEMKERKDKTMLSSISLLGRGIAYMGAITSQKKYNYLFTGAKHKGRGVQCHRKETPAFKKTSEKKSDPKKNLRKTIGVNRFKVGVSRV